MQEKNFSKNIWIRREQGCAKSLLIILLFFFCLLSIPNKIFFKRPSKTDGRFVCYFWFS